MMERCRKNYLCSRYDANSGSIVVVSVMLPASMGCDGNLAWAVGTVGCLGREQDGERAR